MALDLRTGTSDGGAVARAREGRDRQVRRKRDGRGSVWAGGRRTIIFAASISGNCGSGAHTTHGGSVGLLSSFLPFDILFLCGSYLIHAIMFSLYVCVCVCVSCTACFCDCAQRAFFSSTLLFVFLIRIFYRLFLKNKKNRRPAASSIT